MAEKSDMERVWSGVDAYFEQHLAVREVELEAALEASEKKGLPAIQVSRCQGKQLMLLAQMAGAKRVLEVGTLGGYSTIWLGRAMGADGHLWTLEADAHHARVARENIDKAKLACTVHIVEGPAAQTMPRVVAEAPGKFDMVFIDADKPNTPLYFELAVGATRRGGVIICDNMVRDGRIADGTSTDPAIVAMRGMIEALRNDDRVWATVVQTVGNKGYDGYLMAVVRG